MTRQSLAAIGASGVVALAVGIVVGAGSSSGASPAPRSSGATTVARRNLISTDTESGTLGYANPGTVFNRISGTITMLPTVGQVIRPGQTLYRVDAAPVVLLNGNVPAYRDLSEGVTDGADVQELKQNLVAMGFDPNHQITINQTFDSATAAAVESWQASLGQPQTGTVTLGQVVFQPGPQRITAVDTVLGSTGGSSGASGSASSGASGSSGASSGSSSAGSGSSGSSSSSSGSGSSGSAGSGTASPASTSTSVSHPELVSLMRPTPKAATPNATTPNAITCPTGSAAIASENGKVKCMPQQPSSRSSSSGSPSSTVSALIALLRAETAELQKSRSASAASGAAAGRPSTVASSPAASSGRSGAGGALSGGGASAGTAGGGAGASASAQPILQTTSTQRIVTVNLDATKQTEAVVGEPVTVELPSGSTVNGKITQVSPAAQSSSGSSSSSGAAGGSSSTPTATIPVTITLGQRVRGLDQAAVSVNFEQQVERGVLSVPVTALLATPGGGYAVQEAASPHRLLPVTPGLFAAGYVQISGTSIFEGLQVTDSQG